MATITIDTSDTWQQMANCAGIQPDLFFPALGGDPVHAPVEAEWEGDPVMALERLIESEGETLETMQAAIEPTGREAASEAVEHRLEHMIMRKQEQVDYLMRVVVPDIAAYDAFYKKLIARVELAKVSSAFAMEQVKYPTGLPLGFPVGGGRSCWAQWRERNGSAGVSRVRRCTSA